MRINIFLAICFAVLSCGCADGELEQDDRDSADKQPAKRQDNDVSARNTTAVDIAFVMDTGSSMHYYTAYRFNKRFQNFISEIEQLDWRWFYFLAGERNVNFWSFEWLFGSDYEAEDGEALPLESKDQVLPSRFLTSTTPDYADLFLRTITVPDEVFLECKYPPYCTDMYRQPLTMLKLSFALNKKWTREDADFVSVIVTNGNEPEEGTSPQGVIQEFHNVYGNNKRLFVFGIVVPPNDEKCVIENLRGLGFLNASVEEGTGIEALARETGGGIISICSDDYSSVAQDIVRVIRSGSVSEKTQ